MSAVTAAVPKGRVRISRGWAITLGVTLGLLALLVVLGYGPAIVDLVEWFIEFLLTRPYIILGFAVPIAYGALCGLMNERSGVVNVGIEGMILSSAFTGFLVAAYLHPVIGDVPAALVGVLVAVLTSMLLSALHAWLSITVMADQIISGTVINIIAIGATAYFNQLLISTSDVTGAPTMQGLGLPEGLADVPIIGPLLNAVFGQGPIQTSLIFAVIFMQFMLFQSR